MKRLWYIRIRKRGSHFAARIFNVFDNCEPELPIEIELPDMAAVESLIRALEPVSHVAQIYMDVNEQGALLRTSMLPVEPLDALIARAVIELQSLQQATGLATTFLTRGEVLHRVRRFPKVRPSEAE